MPSIDEVRAQLTGPGAPFEIIEEEVLGEKLPVFKNRARSLRELLQGSERHDGKEYLVMGDRRIAFEAHRQLVASVARGLQEQYGIGPGDRVAILAANCPEWVIAFWATVSLGGIVSALNGWWTPDEIEYGVGLSEPKLLIGDRRRLERAEGLELGVPIVEVESGFAALEGFAPDAELPEQPIAEDDPAVILFTSGTTGRPKGAVASHRGIVGFASQQIAGGAVRAVASGNIPGPDAPQGCALATAPLFHLSGLYAVTVMNMATGGKLVFRGGRFDAGDVLRLIEEERVTQWTPFGAMLHRVMEHPDLETRDLSSMQNTGFGGAPASEDVQAKARRAFPSAAGNLGIGYGSSETVAVVSQLIGAEFTAHPTSVGPLALTIQAEIRDESGNALPEGQEGEIFVRSPYTILEYWRNPEATAKTVLPQRWLATGDIGRFEEGRLYINSRARDLILRGGENIYPAEIENRLDGHPGVAEVAVVGVDHAELGQEVKAIVVPTPGAEPSEEELAAWCGETLAAFKVPSLWELRGEPLPRNAVGKVLKNVLLGEAEHSFVEE
ncbi:MAG: fatty acid--CoA ligase [Deltaproteobacteria bacterium]|jgi:acyl-CoA synthetase (AMP-forming)/AMP-acid ligase II|nr:fatty acid--CoA ligase [Deltaproteobacteria bacterium]